MKFYLPWVQKLYLLFALQDILWIHTGCTGHNMVYWCAMLKYPVHSLVPLTLYGYTSRKFPVIHRICTCPCKVRELSNGGSNMHFTKNIQHIESISYRKVYRVWTPKISANRPIELLVLHLHRFNEQGCSVAGR